MPKPDLLSIKQFAKLLQVPTSTVRYYDNIGLLPAAVRGNNSYRYYSIKQIATANVIFLLQEFDVSLEEIKKILIKRSPEFILSLIKDQMIKIDDDIAGLDKKKEFLSGLYDIIHPSLDINAGDICFQQIEETRIIRGDVNNYEGMDAFGAMAKFYEYIRVNYPYLQFYYPVWGMFSEKRILAGDWKRPDRYYICHNIGSVIRKKALYAVGHTRCWYGGGGALYEKMLLYIDNNGFELCGDVYEEYPLNELCTVNEQEYLMRLLMPVRKKSGVGK